MHISGTYHGSGSGSASDNTLPYDFQLVGGFEIKQLGKNESIVVAPEI